MADDEPSVLRVEARALERLGLTVTTCRDGAEALRLFRADPEAWRVVCLDMSMPALGGVDALLEMRAHRPNLPAVLCTGFPESELIAQLGGAANVERLSKPFTVRELSDALRRLLGPP